MIPAPSISVSAAPFLRLPRLLAVILRPSDSVPSVSELCVLCDLLRRIRSE